ncbi:MAG: hypothetical protein QOF78_2444 [Phycisphaerales bacterium]|nr:hypothetical protein [Phycisphaerales bacterium]
MEVALNLPTLAPFDAIRWNGEAAQVRVDNVWCDWLAIDDMPLERLVAYCKQHYGRDLWQKRIAEDLVEVLIGMGQSPRDRVKLTVRGIDTKIVSELLDVSMTHKNRQQIWMAAQLEQAEKRRQQRR